MYNKKKKFSMKKDGLFEASKYADEKVEKAVKPLREKKKALFN